jgi:hypothetical protein
MPCISLFAFDGKGKGGLRQDDRMYMASSQRFAKSFFSELP